MFCIIYVLVNFHNFFSRQYHDKKFTDFQIKMFHTVGHFHVLCIILPICTDQGGSRCSWCHPHAAASGKCSLSAAFSRVGFIWDTFLFKTPLIKLAGDSDYYCLQKTYGKYFDVWHSVFLWPCVYFLSSLTYRISANNCRQLVFFEFEIDWRKFPIVVAILADSPT